MPSTVEQVHRQMGPRGLTVLAINLAEARVPVKRWLKRRGVTVTALFDPDGTAATAYRVTATPTVVLVDRAGRMVGRATGPRPWLDERGRALFDVLLGTPAPR